MRRREGNESKMTWTSPQKSGNSTKPMEYATINALPLYPNDPTNSCTKVRYKHDVARRREELGRGARNNVSMESNYPCSSRNPPHHYIFYICSIHARRRLAPRPGGVVIADMGRQGAATCYDTYRYDAPAEIVADAVVGVIDTAATPTDEEDGVRVSLHIIVLLFRRGNKPELLRPVTTTPTTPARRGV
ncbi:hypothetical protein AB1N83_012759 [Pleurotus pulmonarius]